ncbi:cytochrome P450 3A4-like [Ylistrum balloti]|uniref:cytochrome P450 3A4-like n=1 Tax=Ylistrum balloti TaxID=509963 RepID=UPI002905E3BE|nr:cytochrome P450 3A4-like [Ylistrum balloti]
MEITDLLQWIIVLLMAFVFYAFMMSRDFWTFRRMGIPGPTPLPIVGNLMALVGKGFREFDISTIKMYGKVFGHFDMLSANLVVADKEILKEILVKQFNNFIDKRTFDGYNGDLEHGLTVNRGEHWKRNRSIVTPAFSSSKLRKMVPLIQEACDTLVKTLPHSIRAGDHGQVELTRLFRACTMDMISSTAFGIRVDSQGNPNDPFVMNAKKMFDFSLTGPKILLMLFCPALKPLLLKLGVCIFPHDSMAYFRKLTAQLLDERRRSKNMCREDFLQLMVDAREGRLGKDGEDEDCTAKNILLNEHHQSLTFEEILGNVELFYVAGYETTAITLTMLSYNLATHPECQERLRQEIEEEIGSEPIGIDNLNKLQYLEMCINETLRMYSPFMRFDRKCVRTTKVKDMTIPAGMVVSVPINAIHRDPEVWEKPDVFNPERFSASERAKHDPMDFLPFGHGPRGCIGTRLAYIELKMAMVAVIQNFRLLVGSKTDIPPNMVENAVLMPSSVWLKLEEIV